MDDFVGFCIGILCLSLAGAVIVATINTFS